MRTKFIVFTIFGFCLALKSFPQPISPDTLIQKAQEIEYGDSDSAISLYKKAINLSEENKYVNGIYVASYRLSQLYQSLNQFNTAIFIAEKGLSKIPESDSVKIASLIAHKGRLLSILGKGKEGVDALLKAIALQEKVDTNQLVVSYVNIALCFLNIHDYGNAKKYFDLALIEDTKAGNENGLAQTYINLAGLHSNIGEKDKSLVYINKAHEIVKKTNLKMGLAFVYYHSGIIQMDNANYEEAKNFFEKDLAIRYELKDEQGIAFALFNMGLYYAKVNQSQLAEKYFLKAINKAENLGIMALQTSVYSEMAKFYSTNNQHQKAFEMQKKNQQVKDSLYDLNKTQAAMEMEKIYQTQKKEQELASKELLLQKQNNTITLLEKQKELDGKNKFLLILFLCLGFTVIIAVLTLRYFRSQKKLEENYTQKLIDSQEEERRRIATELHDSVGQKLSLARSGIELMKEGKVGGKLPDISNQMDSVIEELRNISREMHPAELEALGLEVAIETLLARTQKLSGIFTSFEIDKVDGKLNLQQKINCYRIVQEFISNTVKHAKATALKVSIFEKNEDLAIKMQDNGKGFSQLQKKKKMGLGLNNMSKRVKLLKGELTISSENGKGTTIEITFPVA